MIKEVFITKSSSFFPNSPVSNEEMENKLGLIAGKHSRFKNVVLRQNGIKQRYYALDENQQVTHTNAELALNSMVSLFDKSFKHDDLELLTCATSVPDQLLPSHASMLHGLFKHRPVEIFSSSGVCLTSMQALKIAYLSIKAGEVRNAICSTSELLSPILLSKNFDKEYEELSKIDKNPYIAYEKDFLRFMLSDGASSILLKDTPDGETVLKIEFIDMVSYAHELPTCMYQGADLNNDGELKSWKLYNSADISGKSIFAVKQDIKQLKQNGIKYFAKHIKDALSKHDIDSQSIKYFLPHISSMFFYQPLLDEMKNVNVPIEQSKWFLNLPDIGNIGSAAILASLDGLIKSKKLNSGDKILLAVPESGRFSYGTALLSVV